MMNAKEVMAKPIIITTKRISTARSSKKQKPENAFSGVFSLKLACEVSCRAKGLRNPQYHIILHLSSSIVKVLFFQNVFGLAAGMTDGILSRVTGGAEIFFGKRHGFQHPFKA
jgi:hypothetical protein